MNKTRWRSNQHVERAAQRAIRWSGPRTAVARALRKSLSAVSHEAADRCNPQILDLLGALFDASDTTARGFAEAIQEIVELRDIIEASTPTLVKRGLWLMDEENRADYREDCASMESPAAHAEALREHASKAGELAQILDELAFRGEDLHALYRAQRSA